MKLVLWCFLISGLLFASIFLAYRASKGVGCFGKALRYVGVLVSTMPIIGFIQAAIAARMNNKVYSESCAYQAAAGVVYYLAVTKILPLVG